MFIGEYSHSIDEKGRVSLPVKFRARLASGCVITRGIDKCLWVYPLDEWEKLDGFTWPEPTVGIEGVEEMVGTVKADCHRHDDPRPLADRQGSKAA